MSLFYLTSASSSFASNNQTSLKIDCTDYGLKNIVEANTETYKFYLCLNEKEGPTSYYYLGGMMKNNKDLFTLLPVISWAQGYFLVENEGFYYIRSPECGPDKISILRCDTFTPSMFSIYEGNKLLDEEEVLNSKTYI